ncbi:hypothetical protein ACWDD9_34695 [Kitasatospora sp. NPDC001119]
MTVHITFWEGKVTLRSDEWAVLESLARKKQGWTIGEQPLEDRYRPSSIVRTLSEKGLSKLATARRLDALARDGVRPPWAARITRLGRSVLEYRAHQESPPEPVPPAPTSAPGSEINVRAVDMDLFRTTLAAAEAGSLTDIDVTALQSVVSKARPVPGTHRHALAPDKAELAVVLHVLFLESLYRDASGYHQLLRELPMSWRRGRRQVVIRTPLDRSAAITAL